MLVLFSDILTAAIQNGSTDGIEYHVIFDLPSHLQGIITSSTQSFRHFECHR